MISDSSAIAVLIPAYNPSPALVTLVDEVRRMQFANAIIVVNDGSCSDCDEIFTSLQCPDGTVVLHHSKNLGKGAALKSGFDYIRRCRPDVSCVVTADADGQHTPKNIRDVASQWLQDRQAVVLGTRAFDGSVPLRSRVGNAATAVIVRGLLRLKIDDTQTGLRAIPAQHLPSLLAIALNRYEFEMEMLLMCKRQRIPIRQVAIETIYTGGNATSHFNPIIDSVKIYMVLLRYVMASIVTTAADFLLFVLLARYVSSVMILTFASRTAGVAVNYGMVRSVVFHSRERVARTLPKYLALVAISGFLSSVLVTHYMTYGTSLIAAKVAAELTLYVANFLVQRNLIFGLAEKQ